MKTYIELEMIAEPGMIKESDKIVPLVKEKDELLSICVGSVKTIQDSIDNPK
jgi:hypothetical protein